MAAETAKTELIKRRLKSAIRKTLASPLLGRTMAALSAGSRKLAPGAVGNAAANVDWVQLPRDEGAHDTRLEWWYWSGHLRADCGRGFGFELVFFELRLAAIVFQVTHHALTDIQERSFQHRVEWGAKAKRSPARGLRLSHDDLWAEGRDGRDRIHGRVDDYQLDLTLAARKPPVLQHDRGYLEYDFGGSTYYYSRKRMDARGTLRAAGRRLAVRGSAWFDHQWGNMGWVFDRSWDWFGIQLDDEREIMVFRMRVGGEEKLRGGSCCSATGRVSRLDPAEIEITPRGAWTSPHSGCTYPRQWALRIRGQQLMLTPVLEDQELWRSIPIYWEGAAAVSGAASGMAYIELNNPCS